uniref:(northern house mosquito) hypothetical protein n=1 Tax=Culex pipiens TaxID=7175 RepID=A0A8D8JQI4_CULPI
MQRPHGDVVVPQLWKRLRSQRTLRRRSGLAESAHHSGLVHRRFGDAAVRVADLDRYGQLAAHESASQVEQFRNDVRDDDAAVEAVARQLSGEQNQGLPGVDDDAVEPFGLEPVGSAEH